MQASQQLTPSQIRFMDETRARRARIAAAALKIADVAQWTEHSATNREAVGSTPAVRATPECEPVKSWVERQMEAYRKPWFCIVDEIDPPATTNPSIGLIQRTCAEHYDLSITTLLSDTRQAIVVRARQVAMFLSKEMTQRSMPDIGRMTGDRDHTTVLHAVRKIARLESENSELADTLNHLREKIRRAC